MAGDVPENVEKEGGVARLEPVGLGYESTKESNAMKEATPFAASVPSDFVEAAAEEVRASFERLCLTAGLASLSEMMEGDAVRLCGPRYGRGGGKDVYLPRDRRRQVPSGPHGVRLH